MPARKSPQIHANADRCGRDTGETGSFISEVSLRTKPALLLLAGLVLGFVSGLWYAGQPSREQSPAPEQPDTNPFEQQAEQLRIEIRKKDDPYLIQCLLLHFDIYKRIQAKSFDFHELFFLKSLSINLKKTISKHNHIDICPLWQIIQLLIHLRCCTSENEHLEVILVKKAL